MIHWEAPGYLVAFTTRAGGVSGGVYESLNLTTGTGDEAGLVEENRRIACAALGLDADRLAFNRQMHSPTVHRARAGARGEPGDGLWSDEPGLPLLAMSADCLPIVVVRRDRPRALALLHAGWRGLADGVVAAGVAALGPGSKAAVVRAGDRAVLLRGRRRGCSPLRRRPDQRAEARSLERRRACAPRGRCRHGRAHRPVHTLSPGALLLAPAKRACARRPGGARCCRLIRFARASNACRTSSGPR